VRIRIAAVLIERDNPLEVGVELVAAEVVFLPPRELGAGVCREDGLELRRRDRLRALERKARNLDAAVFFAAGGRQEQETHEDP
jgi:hypothetical protein